MNYKEVDIIVSKLKKNFQKIRSLFIVFMLVVFSNISNVYAIEKIEGGDVTLESLGKIIKDLATKFQVFGVIVSFIMLVIFTIQFIIADDEGKQRKKKLILYTLGGVVLLILIPSIINFIIDIF